MAPRSAPTRSRARASGSAGPTRPLSSPTMSRAAWREAGGRGAATRQAWEARLQALAPDRRAEFERRQRRELPPGFDQAIAEICDGFRKSAPRSRPARPRARCSTRLTRVVPELVGGSADLTPLEQHQGQGPERGPPRRFCRPLHPLRRARARHGGGDERHRRAWRAHSLWRHVPVLHRLLPPVDPLVGVHEPRRHLCDDPRFDRARRGRADPSAGRASGGVARDPRALLFTARPTRSRPPNAGRWRCIGATRPRCWR